jgi:alkaline phosphatase D
MKRPPIMLFLAGLFLLYQIPTLAFSEMTFTSGIASGDVTDTAVVLWTRVNQTALLFAQVAHDKDFHQVVKFLPVVASQVNDFTVKAYVDNLQPLTRYYYRFVHFPIDTNPLRGQLSATGTFRTAPPRHFSINVRFMYSGDSEAAFQPFEVLRAVRNENPDFFVYLGDTIYADDDSEAGNVTTVDPQDSLEIYRAKYLENRDDIFLQELLAATSIYAIWDDHEVINDFAGETVNPTLLASGLQAFLEYMPIRENWLQPDRLFRSFRWGKDVELFILDERQYRGAKRVCTNEEGQLLLIPLLRDPNCFWTELAAPDRTLLGLRQRFWLAVHLLSSDATFKFIINQVPMSLLLLLPYDRWEGYFAEREKLLQFIRFFDIPNIIFLTTDLHGSLIIDVKHFLSGDTMAKEIVVGPIATDTLGGGLLQREVYVEAFRKHLTGKGVLPTCVNLDTFSYAAVEINSLASPKEVTITLKDKHGIPILDVFTQEECRINIPDKRRQN